MDRAARASMRRCLRVGKTLRCVPSPANSTPRSLCLATSICPGRPVAAKSTTASTSFPVRKTLRPHPHPQRSYSTPSTSSSSSPSTTTSPQSPPEHLNPKELEIYELLMKELQPTRLEVQDISGGCGSMYGIDVVSEKFRGLGMLKQQRLVNDVLGEEIKKWHGVQLKTKAPE
ncbi:hypothetical protein VTL71DRAFT_4704 [Oculimacula yallundae]|uniref:Bola-like protein n=1 Tax=Oculimacula yallundae TaxID=86028 RepID=A0ABR4C3I4_9HELO